MEGKLHVETVDPGTLELIKRLAADRKLDGFNLVGGTALALQMGHRRSIDVDLFSTRRFDTGELAEHLIRHYGADFYIQTNKAINGNIGEVRVDLMTDPFPVIDAPIRKEGVRMLSLRDIGAMKMGVVSDTGGQLKDFADLYTLLEKNPLGTYLDYARQKYPDVDQAALKSLLVSRPNVDLDSKVHYLGRPLEFHEMTARFKEAFGNPAKVFGDPGDLKNEHRIERKSPRHRRGLRPG